MKQFTAGRACAGETGCGRRGEELRVSLNVFLVEHNNPFPSGSEGRKVRAGIEKKLRGWLDAVVRDGNAPRPPSGHSRKVNVTWTRAIARARVDDRAIVVYFSPKPTAQKNETVLGNEFSQAGARVADKDVRKLLSKKRSSYPYGINRKLHDGTGKPVYPILSEVFVLYDAQLSLRSLRIEENVQTFARCAIHEAAHGKCEGMADLHKDGGGGAFADVSGNSAFTPANRRFLAKYVWEWGPQYILGQALKRV